jgi:ATP-dependent DNA helicase RecG
MVEKGRPEVLFPLFAGLETLDGVGPKTAKNFTGLAVETPKDLLLTPAAGRDRPRAEASIRDVALPGTAPWRSRWAATARPRGAGPTGWRSTMRPQGSNWCSSTRAATTCSGFCPQVRGGLCPGGWSCSTASRRWPIPTTCSPRGGGTLPSFEPVYPLTAGVTQKTMFKAARSALARAPELPEWIDAELKRQKDWPDWHAALAQAHAPEGPEDVSRSAKARERLAFDELMAHQLTLALARHSRRRQKGFASRGDGALRQKVLTSLPFSPTGAQLRATAEIEADMGADTRMSRLLQGDVGAGKTLVALMALLIAVEAGGQGVMMAPTSILAGQHYANLKPMAEAAGVVIEILTGADKGAERAAKLRALAKGDIQILVGTHAVFQEDVSFANLRLAIVDEQHRFGVAERVRLSAKGQATDVLVMTATPIPRTLSLAQYGDMDVSVLDEKPPGRKPVKTALLSTARIAEVVSHLRRALAEGRQAYWVCPLVEESEVYDAVAAEERFAHLRAELGEGKVGLVHGRLSPVRNPRSWPRFRRATQVLVATTVIEVGVDVPNASIMVVEQADMFGLSQLHQLRGRVGRGAAESTCLLLYRSPLGETAKRRLMVLRETEDGFRIAEEDLAIRGAGDLIGTAQSGLPRFRIADLELQTPLMALAQSGARALLSRDPGLESDQGRAARTLLWLMEQDKAIGLIRAG